MVRGEEGRGRGRGRHVVREGRRPVWWGKGRGEDPHGKSWRTIEERYDGK